MTAELRMVSPEAVVQRNNDGELLITNKIALADYPENLLTWLHRHAERQPDKAFLRGRGVDGDWKSISFGEMAAKANQFSNGLVALDLAAEAPIALLSHNCIDMAMVMFGAMQIGHPVAPISLAYSVRSQTGELVNHVLETTGAPVLVMSDADLHMPKLHRWDLSGRRLLAFRNGEKHQDVQPFDAILTEDVQLGEVEKKRFAAVRASTLAKIQFTSGSTNLPKGVEVTHGMMTSNQIGIHQLWPFLESDEVLCDWLPWNHTFGGNFVTNLALMHGATMYIDDGNPSPGGIQKMVDNIIEVRPTLYFGVPASYAALYARLQGDSKLRRAFFERLKFVFVAAAALDQSTYSGMKQMARTERGVELPFFSAWGATETAPGATLVYWTTDDTRVIGLPLPGTTLKLAAENEPNRYEVRVRGPNVTRGYYRNEAADLSAFDEDGFYCSGDAVALLDENNPNAGLIFDGRIGEDFKLASGVWVHNASVRASIHGLGKPFITEVVLAAPNGPWINALVFPNVEALRERFQELSTENPEDDTFVNASPIIELFRSIFQKHNANETGSSRRIVRFSILTKPPSFDRGEMTDKGYINQRAVLRTQSDLVSRFYDDKPAAGIWEVEPA